MPSPAAIGREEPGAVELSEHRLTKTEELRAPRCGLVLLFFFFQAEDGIRDVAVTGVQTCALPISGPGRVRSAPAGARRRSARYRGAAPDGRCPTAPGSPAPGRGRHLKAGPAQAGARHGP